MANKSNNEYILERRAQIMNTAPFRSSPDNIHSGKNFTFTEKQRVALPFPKNKYLQHKAGPMFSLLSPT